MDKHTSISFAGMHTNINFCNLENEEEYEMIKKLIKEEKDRILADAIKNPSKYL